MVLRSLLFAIGLIADSVSSVFHRVGLRVSLVADSAGFVFQGLLGCRVNTVNSVVESVSAVLHFVGGIVSGVAHRISIVFNEVGSVLCRLFSRTVAPCHEQTNGGDGREN